MASPAPQPARTYLLAVDDVPEFGIRRGDAISIRGEGVTPGHVTCTISRKQEMGALQLEALRARGILENLERSAPAPVLRLVK